MTYRKFRADYLFTGHEMHDDQFVLISTDDGTIENIVPLQDAGDDIRTLKGVISPGFVNCHCHLELSHLKGIIPENTGMVDFLLAVIGQRNVQPEFIANALADAEHDMLNSGIVAVGDLCNTAFSLTKKAKGNLYYHNFIEAAGFVPAAANDRFNQALELYTTFLQSAPHSTAGHSIVPHAPYSVSPELIDRIAGFEGNNLLTIHNQESEAEDEFFRTGQGDFRRLYASLGIDISWFRPSEKSSLQAVLPHFDRNRSLLLVHNVNTSEADLAFIANRPHGPDLYFCLCPNANRYITGSLPDVPLLLRHDCQLVLGTDSLASNHQLNMVNEMDTLQQAFPQLDTKRMLTWCTLNGARALQIDQFAGSFEPGKKPGIVWMEQATDRTIPKGTTATRIG